MVWKFDKKWKAVLYSVFEMHQHYGWVPMSARTVWNDTSHSYLSVNRIRTYMGFYQGIRRIHSYGFLYRIREGKNHPNFPIPDEFLVSKAGVVRLGRLNVIPKDKVNDYKYHAGSAAREHGVAASRW